MSGPTTLPTQVIRIPNLPDGKIVDEEGFATEDESSFRHTLVTNLQQLFGNEGLVIPTQTQGLSPGDYVTQIQNAQRPDPVTGLPGAYTCQLGTMLYVINNPLDHTKDQVLIAVRNTDDYPLSAPKFKQVTLT